MKTVSNEVDKKIQDTNAYVDGKRGELVQVSTIIIEKTKIQN